VPVQDAAGSQARHGQLEQDGWDLCIASTSANQFAYRVESDLNEQPQRLDFDGDEAFGEPTQWMREPTLDLLCEIADLDHYDIGAFKHLFCQHWREASEDIGHEGFNDVVVDKSIAALVC
jgi:hypothetical protein